MFNFLKINSDVFFSQQMWLYRNSWLVHTRAREDQGELFKVGPTSIGFTSQQDPVVFFSLSCNRHVDIPLNSLRFCSNAFALVSPISLLAKITNTFYEKVKWKRKNISHIWPVFGTYNCISRQTGLENSPTRQQECDNASKSAKAGNRQLGFTLQMPLTHIPEITRTIMVFIV